jgi:hypothetical protein
LVAFDYDHTIVDGNTDTHVVKAAPPGGALPPDLKPESGRWCVPPSCVVGIAGTCVSHH